MILETELVRTPAEVLDLVAELRDDGGKSTARRNLHILYVAETFRSLVGSRLPMRASADRIGIGSRDETALCHSVARYVR